MWENQIVVNASTEATFPATHTHVVDTPGTSTGMFDLFNEKNIVLRRKLRITGNPYGIRNGWFTWPVNFDPVWLENCNGFKNKEEQNESTVD